MKEKQKETPNLNKISKLHNHLEDIENYKKQGTVIRSKERIKLEQEQPNKYFFEQEKTKQKNKTMAELEITQNNETKNINHFEILKECKKCYNELYSKANKNQHEQNKLLKKIVKEVTQEQNQNLTRPLTIKEIQKAISEMEPAKTPGIDGLPVEFYETNFELLKNDLQQLYNSILFENKELPKTMKKVIITLIPKNEETITLKNWRLISLLCADYKILTKILATRLKQILQITTSKEQNCCVPNRSIFSNLLTVRELISYVNDKKQNAFIISRDQEKAFDKVDRNLLYKTMEKLGYSKCFIHIRNNLYKDTQALIINNGYLSKPFNIEGGVRQGCPLSLLLYIAYGELININIKNNEKIRGMKIPNKKELKILQFADDTNPITINEGSIIEIINFFQKYETASGATINTSKTKIIPLANARIYNIQNKIQNFKITKNKDIFKILTYLPTLKLTK